MNTENKVCPFFLKGNCKFGDKCNNPHQLNISQNKQPNNFNNKPNTNYQGNKFNNTGLGNFVNHNNKFGNNNNKYNPNGMQINPNNNNTNNSIINNNPNFNKFDNKNFSNPKPKTGPNNNLCNFFTRPNGCDRGDTCKFLHNYHETLHHIKREVIHQTNIIGCTTTSKFI